MTITTNPEFAATLRILGGPLARKVPAGAVDHVLERIDWPLIADNCCSSTEALLCEVALDLWNGDGCAQVGELVRRLDDDQLRAVLDAIVILRPGVRR